ncbi:metallo-hydrolase oxidoreductase [Diplodia corticola]|uniref:Metallo-hydrolase oxidoreductase n=1 Tax=Diplodia corticola TaxID=236234 RepID=A0A1J9RP71_9PEZI|nr:metallo-hydrolase oxidoreductase [Diplodia corticola]OJD29365.1 metallo-hydrolase oxidoreductase [Diplodia corticola]
MRHSNLVLDPSQPLPPTRDSAAGASVPKSLPPPNEVKVAPLGVGGENAAIYFVGTATTILEWEGIRIMTDPNFLHAGDHVHLGPGVQGTRQTNPAIELSQLPRIDAVLLSHYHADHFDQDVEASLRRSLPIVTTPHAKRHLTTKPASESFTHVFDLDFFDSMFLDVKRPAEQGRVPAIKVTGMPGKHVPPGPAGALKAVNELLQAVPPTNGWMLDIGYRNTVEDEAIYISGDTLLVDELEEIPERYRDQNIDLMLIHLGGTTIPGPKMPLLMVTMDANQGIELMRLINPDMTIPIHYDDYDVFLSPLSDFKKAVDEAGLSNKVTYLDRKDQFKFLVKHQL